MLGGTTSVASPAVAAPILILGRGRGSRRGRATSMVVTTLQRVAPSRNEPGREECAPIFPLRKWISKFFPTYFTPCSAYNGKTISRKWKRILLDVSRGTTHGRFNLRRFNIGRKQLRWPYFSIWTTESFISRSIPRRRDVPRWIKFQIPANFHKKNIFSFYTPFNTRILRVKMFPRKKYRFF